MQTELNRMSWELLTWQFINSARKSDGHPIVDIQHDGLTEDCWAVTGYESLVHIIDQSVVIIVVLVLLLVVILVALLPLLPNAR